MRGRIALCAAAAMGVSAGSVAADEVPIRIYENASGASVTGLDLGVDLIENGSVVDLIFYNRSSISAVVTDIYIESTVISSTLSNGLMTGSIGDVDFVVPANPIAPPAFPSGLGGLWQGSLWSGEGVSPQPTWGIGPGESLTVSFDLGSASVSQLVSAARDPGQFRIVEKIQSLPGGQSVWGVTPTPGSLVLLAMSGLCLCYRRVRS